MSPSTKPKFQRAVWGLADFCRTLIRQVWVVCRGESFRSTDCLAVNRKTESQKRKNDKTCKCRVMWVPYNHSVFGGFRLCDWVMFLDSRWYSLMFIDFRHDFDRRGGSYFRPPDEMSVHNPNSVPDEMCIVTLHPPPVRRDVSAQCQLCPAKHAVPNEMWIRTMPPHPCSEMCMPNDNHCVWRNVCSHTASPIRSAKCAFSCK